MEMDSISFYQQLHLSPPPPSPCPGQAGFSYYCPPFAAADGFHIAAVTGRDKHATLPVPLARVARKDRHSKICTAGGMRDRRMRLSLDVARRFFALQDKLGFDKASKTVQWLLDMSTAGINDLIAATTTSMSMSMSEDGSVLLDSDQIMIADSAERNNCKQRPKASKLKHRAAPPPRKKSNANAAAARVLPDKESRARAREKARERARERNRLRSIQAPAASQQAVPAGCSSFVDHGSYYEQEPWELSGVVFAKAR